VVGDIRDGVSKLAPGMIYLPLRPADYARPGLHGVTLVVRSKPRVDALTAVRRDIAALDERLTPFESRSMLEQVDEMMFAVRSALWTYGVIGAFGLILAAVGLAGLTAYSVARRRREIGIRVALGARRVDVLRLVMTEGAALVGAGSVIGLGLAWAGIRMLASVLTSIAKTSETSTSDPKLLLGAPLLLAALALLACYLPARRSLAIEPAVTLRQE
jgi:putative ABC transport system permease protein